MKFCSIASGSSGNCVYVGSDEANILVDAGISAKRIEAAFASMGTEAASIDGIFITHEHSDHIQGVGALARKYGIPIYATVETINSMLKIASVGRIPSEQFKYIEPNKTLQIKDIIVEPFSISHDASNPVSYTFSCCGKKLGMATDLGTYDEYTISKLQDADCLYLEANHDINMLMVGSYPYYLKQRIAGNRGHLSNDASAKLICRLQSDRLQEVVLAHMSKENNYAELAYETVRYEVERNWTFEHKPEIMVAYRDMPSQMIRF